MNNKTIRELSQIEIGDGVFLKELSDCIILIKNNSLILQFRPRNPEKIGTISLFGGHIEQGETPLEAVIREINEETGGSPNVKDMVFYWGCDRRVDKPY